MNFFSQLLQKPPVPDKDNNKNDSEDEDEFTVTKGKTLKGFNDDVSEIELGSEIINDDSINEIKNQQKLLTGQSQYENRRGKRLADRSIDEFSNDPFLSNPSSSVYETFNPKKDSKNSKFSVESKIAYQSRPTADFGGNIQREYSLRTSLNAYSPMPASPAKARKHTELLLANLAELKKLKSAFNQTVAEETAKYKRYLETMKSTVQVEIKKRLINYVSSVQSKFRTSQKSEQVALKARLKQSQKQITQLKAQIAEISQQNQTLQQKQFDLQQKIVGVDLQVQKKFQKKRKQLQKKIYQQLTQNSSSDPSFPKPVELINNVNAEVVENLVEQNEFLQNKIQSYEKILIETDQVRKMKQNIEQRQLIVGKRESDLEIQKSQIETQVKHTQKHSVTLSQAQETLNNQISQLKQNLKTKEDELHKWEQELQRKALQLNVKQTNSPKSSSPSFPAQSYNVTFQKGNQPKMNYRSPSDQQFSRKIQTINLQKVTPKITENHIETFRNTIDLTNNKIKSETQKIYKKDDHPKISNNNVTYDPSKHADYERFDLQSRQKATNHYADKYSNLDTDKRTSPNPNHLSIHDQRFSKKTDYDSISRDSSVNKNRLGSFKLSQHTEGKKVSAQFYQPAVKNTFKYEPQFIQKPTSSPGSQHIPASRLIQNYKTHSPHNRDPMGSVYRGSHQNMREKYLQPSKDRSTFSRSSKDNSTSSYSPIKGANVSHQYDMNKSKPKFEMGRLNELGSKIESLKNELKHQIDTID